MQASKRGALVHVLLVQEPHLGVADGLGPAEEAVDLRVSGRSINKDQQEFVKNFHHLDSFFTIFQEKSPKLKTFRDDLF